MTITGGTSTARGVRGRLFQVNEENQYPVDRETAVIEEHVSTPSLSKRNSFSTDDSTEKSMDMYHTNSLKHEMYFFGGQRHHFKQFKPYFNNLALQKMKAGAAHQLILSAKPDHHLYIMGRGYGIGKYQESKDRPVNLSVVDPVVSRHRILSFATKGWHSLLVTDGEGYVISWGQNEYGQCGVGNTTNPLDSPAVIPNLKGIKHAATGTCHSIVAGDRTVYTFGSSKYGRLGIGPITNQVIVPTQVKFFDHVFAQSPHLKVVQVSAACNNSLVLDNSGAVYIMGKFQSTDCQTPVKVEIPTRVRFVSGGDFFTSMITCTDELYTFGDDSYGQLGQGMMKYVKEPMKVQGLDGDVDKVCTGSNHMACLLKNGKVYTWGKGEQGRLGHRDTNNANLSRPKQLMRVVNKNIKQLDATSDYIIMCNSEVFVEECQHTIQDYQRRNLKKIARNGFFSDCDIFTFST